MTMTSKRIFPLPAMALLLVTVTSLADEQVQVTHITDDNVDRVPLQTVVPVYPKAARRDRIEGEVQVCFNVDRKGRTYRLAVRTSTNRIFERPSIKAIRESTYRRLPKDEKLSGIKTCRTFRFRLDPVAVERPASVSDGQD
jgi:TonB family protein